MFEIIIPQAIRSILPSLGNESHAAEGLFPDYRHRRQKSCCMRPGRASYEPHLRAMFPLLGVAAIYLVLVMLFSALLANLRGGWRKVIDVKGLKKNYGGLQVLKGVDLTIARGVTASYCRPSGCGKSNVPALFGTGWKSRMTATSSSTARKSPITTLTMCA